MEISEWNKTGAMIGRQIERGRVQIKAIKRENLRKIGVLDEVYVDSVAKL